MVQVCLVWCGSIPDDELPLQAVIE
uniref:Uncharacterized protein n=1 Tax=Arundo donax TaxID=35708 RepID=A0A0A9BCT9_ARUDO